LVVNLKQKVNKWAAICLMTLLVALISYFTFRNLPMSYYMYVLSPVMLFITADYFFKLFNHKKSSFLTVLVVLVSFSFLRISLMFFINIFHTDYTLMAVENQLAKYKNMAGKKIGVSSSMWIFFGDDYKCSPGICYNLITPDFDYMILQQYGSGYLQPKEIAGFEIIEDHFEKKPLGIGTLTISKYAPFYQYAVYKRK